MNCCFHANLRAMMVVRGWALKVWGLKLRATLRRNGRRALSFGQRTLEIVTRLAIHDNKCNAAAVLARERTGHAVRKSGRAGVGGPERCPDFRAWGSFP